MSKKKLLSGLFAISCIMVSQAFAGDMQALKGTYRGVVHVNCLESVDGFTAPPDLRFVQRPGNFAARYADVYVSTAVFNGDGTMTESVAGTTIFGGEAYDGALAAGTFVDTCHYTLASIGNGTFSLKGNCAGHIPTGPAAGLTITVTDIDAQMQLSDDHRMILLGGPEPDSNTLALNTGYTAPRLCAPMGTYMRVNP